MLLAGCSGAASSIDDGSRQINPFTSPCLELPDTVSFGPTSVGCELSRQRVTVRNRCALRLTLTTEKPAGPFGVAALPMTLEPGEQAPLSVGFAPVSTGAVAAVLTVFVHANDSTQRNTFAVEGVGVTARTVSFEQLAPVPRRTSLLVIVDDDGLTNAQQNFRDFARYLVTAGWPRVDVVVSNLSGGLQSPDGVTVLSTDDAEFEARFQRATRTAPTAGRRSCHDTALSLRDRREPAGFWEQPHAIICVTDEPDGSDLPGSEMIARWASGRVLSPFSVISPSRVAVESCGRAEPRFERLVTATNGLREDLCTPNWATALQTISKATLGFQTTFYLPSAPSLRSVQSLEVSVEGVPFPQVDFRGARSWRYDSVLHAIILEPLYTPSPGQRLETRWQTCD